MSIHISAEKGAVAETVLLPGDPLRARFIAETYLRDPVCYNRIRNMEGYTGHFNGTRVSVQGSGMGQASLAIYTEELIRSYGVKRVIRVGSCGAMQSNIGLREIIIPLSASTDSSMNRIRFQGMDFAPSPTWRLVEAAVAESRRRDAEPRLGTILSTDSFYTADPDLWRLWARYGVLAAEMESSALFTIAASHGVEALTILTVSDNIATGESTEAEERERGFKLMAEIALSLA